MTLSRQFLYVAMALALFVGFLLNIGGFALFDVDEGSFSQASREMLLNGDFVAITLNGAPRFDKPVLIYWLQATSAAVLGNDTFSYRLPSALASMAWAAAIFVFTRRVIDARTAAVAAILMATSAQVSIIGKAATADATLNLFLALSVLSLFVWLEDRSRRALYLMAAAIGLGVLTKGPVAIMIPGAVAVLCAVVSPRYWRPVLTIPISPMVWIIALLIVLPWPLMLLAREGADFFREFIFVHNLGRFSEPLEAHSGPIYYYAIALVLGFLPHSAILLIALWRSMRDFGDPLNRFLLIWFAFVFAFFSLSATKLPHYLIYGSTGLFILMARQLPLIAQRWWLFLPQVLAAVLILAIPVVLANHATWIGDDELARMLDGPPVIGTGWNLAGLALLVMGVGFAIDRRLSLELKQVVSGLALAAFIALWLMPTAAAFQQRSVVAAATLAQGMANPIVSYRVDKPSFNVYAGRPSEPRSPAAGDLVFTRTRSLAELPPHTVLFDAQGVALVGIEPFQPRPAE